MARYRVKNTKPIDNVLERVERLEKIMDVLDLTIPQEVYEMLEPKYQDLFEEIEG